MATPTYGTDLYFKDPDTSVVTRVTCVTSIEGLGSTNEQIDVTCLSDRDRRFMAGLGSPGAATIGINVDGDDATHVRLHQLHKSREDVQFAIGWSDGTSDPVLDSAGDFVASSDRSWTFFQGNIQDFPFSFALAAAVTTSLSIQTSGGVEWVPKVSP